MSAKGGLKGLVERMRDDAAERQGCNGGLPSEAAVAIAGYADELDALRGWEEVARKALVLEQNAPASEPVGGESRFPCRFKENTGWCETHAQYANDADHCQGASTPSVPTAEAGVVMTEPPVDVLKRTIQNIESQEIRRSGLFIVDRVDIAILDEIVAALSTPSPQGAVAWISEVGMARLRRGQSCQAYGRGDVQPGVSPFYPAPSGVSEEMVALIADGAEWRRDDGRTYLAIRVADGADLSCVATRRAALKAALSGEGE